jgi:hypothetical protein
MIGKLQHLQSLASKFAQSGKFIGWRQIEFELKFEKDFEIAREWLHRPETREELERLCQEARHSASSARHKAA